MLPAALLAAAPVVAAAAPAAAPAATGLMATAAPAAVSGLMGGGDIGSVVSQFMPIADDADFFSRMQAGEFDDWDNLDDESKAGVMDYINKPESSITSQQIGAQGLGQAGKLGMSANQDMSGFAQSTPMQGLMGQATAGINQRPQRQPFQMAQGLMNPWGG